MVVYVDSLAIKTGSNGVLYHTIIIQIEVSIVGSLRDREVACSASDRQGSNFESCVWRTVSSQSSHHPQEVLLAQFSLYVHKGGLKPDSFHFIYSDRIYQFTQFPKISIFASGNLGRHLEQLKMSFDRADDLQSSK